MRSKHAEIATKNLVELLKKKRLEKGYSHQTLADIASIHRSTISRIESGERIPTITLCLRISEALEVSLATLLTKALKA